MSQYTAKLTEDDEGNLILPLPKELFEGHFPWHIDDKLEWTVNDDNTVILTNLSWLIRNENGFG